METLREKKKQGKKLGRIRNENKNVLKKINRKHLPDS